MVLEIINQMSINQKSSLIVWNTVGHGRVPVVSRFQDASERLFDFVMAPTLAGWFSGLSKLKLNFFQLKPTTTHLKMETHITDVFARGNS